MSAVIPLLKMKINVEQGIVKADQLIEVQHINAVCGRNNSGKSTLLRAIEQGQVEAAEYLEPSAQAKYWAIVRQSMNSQSAGNLDRALKAVTQVLASYADSGGCIATGENRLLADKMVSA